MTGAQVLNVIMARIGTGSGVTSINTEVDGVLYDITSRADFYTSVSVINTVVDQYEYDEPEGLKRIYECSISGTGLLEKKTYRDYLKALADGTAAISEQPLYYARRHGKLYVWPSPDAVYAVDVDFAGFHPETWTDILLGPEFNEAIFEGVLAALYRGQLFEKLRLNNKKITNRDILEDVTQDQDVTTDTDADGTADDKTVTVDDGFIGSVNTDDDSEALTYEFDKGFPEISKHAEAYEAEIEKLIENLEQDIETVLVEYRDI
ncbi:MAG: hypothetical protein FVQ82_04685 [Planctomycetes bacterium]|nr:hypothetical protein [Planctomycetota bacterium]